MTKILILTALFSSPLLFAENFTLKDLPETIVCQALSKNYLLKRPFTILNLKGESSLEGLDARSDGQAEVDNFLTQITANNGCDNNYQIALLTEDLVAIARHHRTEAHGIMQFTNSESQCVDEACELSESAPLVCHLLR